MRADRRIHPTTLGQAGPHRNNRHAELIVKIADFNRRHPIGSTVWIEDGSEHRRKARVTHQAFVDGSSNATCCVKIEGEFWDSQPVNLDDVKDIPA